MTTLIMTCLVALFVLPLAVTAHPITGIYHSTDLGGQLLTGRASTWRPGINSGLPHVLHIASWDDTTLALGTQWEITCPIENSDFSVVDNRTDGNGTVVYTSTFTGGTFTFLAGGWPWGDGSGVLGTTTLITTVQFQMINGNSTPVASVVNGNSSGTFGNGCVMNFAIANGVGVGETTSLDPSITIPPDYPVFLDDTCGPASVGQQYGTWGTVISITVSINCTVENESETWGGIKSLYR